MPVKINVSLVVVMVSLSGCSSELAEAPAAVPAAPQGASGLQAPGARELVLRLERGPCFGRCPVYVVEVYANGCVAYRGEYSVVIAEPAEIYIPLADVAAIRERLTAIDFASLGDYRSRDVSDMSTEVFTTADGHRVEHNLGDASAPVSLEELGVLMDALTTVERWTTGSSQWAEVR